MRYFLTAVILVVICAGTAMAGTVVNDCSSGTRCAKPKVV